MQSYLAAEQKEVMILAGKGKELEIMTLCQVSQTQKDKYYISIIHLFYI